MTFNWFRRKPPEPQILLDTRKVNLSDVGQSPETLSMRIERPDQYRPLDPMFAADPVDAAAVTAETMSLVDAAAPVVDEFIADVLNGWLDEHIPGWQSRTDLETVRRLDLQRVLIAEMTQNYALVGARLGHQRRLVAKLDQVVERAERILAGRSGELQDRLDHQQAHAESSVDALRLRDPADFGHLDLPAPANSPAAIAAPGLAIVHGTSTALPQSDNQGDVA